MRRRRRSATGIGRRWSFANQGPRPKAQNPMSNAKPLLLAFALLVVPMLANAQDRLPPIPDDKLTDEYKKAVAEFKAARNAELTGPFIPMLRSPEVLSRARAMGDYLRYVSALPPRLSEFVILMAASEWKQEYEWGVHHPAAMKAGVPS